MKQESAAARGLTRRDFLGKSIKFGCAAAIPLSFLPRTAFGFRGFAFWKNNNNVSTLRSTQFYAQALVNMIGSGSSLRTTQFYAQALVNMIGSGSSLRTTQLYSQALVDNVGASSNMRCTQAYVQILVSP